MEAVNARGDAMLFSCIAVGATVTIAVFLRLVARWKSKAAFAVDDWLIVASLVPTYGMLVCGGFSLSPCILFLFAINIYVVVRDGGAGRPIESLTDAQITIFLKVRIFWNLKNHINQIESYTAFSHCRPP